MIEERKKDILRNYLKGEMSCDEATSKILHLLDVSNSFCKNKKCSECIKVRITTKGLECGYIQNDC